MLQSAQEQKYYDTAAGALMKHDIPFVAIKVVAVVECHSLIAPTNPYAGPPR